MPGDLVFMLIFITAFVLIAIKGERSWLRVTLKHLKKAKRKNG